MEEMHYHDAPDQDSSKRGFAAYRLYDWLSFTALDSAWLASRASGAKCPKTVEARLSPLSTARYVERMKRAHATQESQIQAMHSSTHDHPSRLVLLAGISCSPGIPPVTV